MIEVLCFLITTIINVVMFGSLLGCAVEYFKDQRYMRFGIALGMSFTNLFILFKIFAL